MIVSFHFKFQKNYWKLCLLLLLFSPLKSLSQHAEPILIRQLLTLKSIGNQTYYLEDNNNQLNIKEVISLDKQLKFEKNEGKIFKRFASPSAFWFKIKFQNLSNEEVWLKIGDGYSTWYLDYYEADSLGEYTQAKIQLGALRPQKNKVFPGNYYCVRLAKADERQVKTCYIRIAGKFQKVAVFEIGTSWQLAKNLNRYDFAVGAFITLIISMLIYNFFIWISTYYKVYLIYVLYLAYVLLIVPFLNGYPLFYANWFWEYYFIFTNFIYVPATLFITNLLSLFRVKRVIYYLIWSLTLIISGILPLLSIIKLLPIATIASSFRLFTLIYLFFLLITGIYLWIKGHKNARFFTLAWVSIITSVFIYILSLHDILPFNDFTRHITYVGFSLETLLFTLALGDRLNTLKKEKELIHSQNLTLIREHNEELEQKVAVRTKELQKAKNKIMTQNEEINAQNEEILEMNELLEEKIKKRTQLLALKNKKLQEYAFANAHQVRAPLANILGIVILLEAEKLPDSTHNYVSMISYCANQLDQIIKEMNQILEDASFFEEDE